MDSQRLYQLGSLRSLKAISTLEESQVRLREAVRRVHVSCKTSYERYNQKHLEYLGLTRIDAIDICIDRAGLNQVPWASSCTQTLVNFLYIY